MKNNDKKKRQKQKHEARKRAKQLNCPNDPASIRRVFSSVKTVDFEQPVWFTFFACGTKGNLKSISDEITARGYEIVETIRHDGEYRMEFDMVAVRNERTLRDEIEDLKTFLNSRAISYNGFEFGATEKKPDDQEKAMLRLKSRRRDMVIRDSDRRPYLD